MDPADERVKYIDVAEFRRFGYLSELNRLFLHPLGLALEVEIADDGTEALSGIWDCRDDPEGIVYDDSLLGTISANAARVDRALEARKAGRVEALGYWIQDVHHG